MENDPKVIIAENIKKYLNKNKMSQKTLAEKISLRPSTVSDYLNYRSKPSHGVIQKIADVFGVHKSDIDTTFKYENTQEPLIIKEENEEKKAYYALNVKETRDIAKEVEQILADLESDKALAFSGEPMDEETKRLFAISLENSLRLAREMAKKKYTPKKYRETE